jgi:hypothetical protein
MSLQKNNSSCSCQETLYGIEKKYNVSDEALKEANPLVERRSCK